MLIRSPKTAIAVLALALTLPFAGTASADQRRPSIPRVEVPNLRTPDPLNNRYDRTRQQRQQVEPRVFAPPGCSGNLTAQQRANCRAKYQYRNEN
ncbi:hypothetical protein [Afifella sp. IM 167]|uniref:hypothetical protein n=1 Tax=Afifella sp. IM 167 TaxID=2033586 RepID=UPI001CCF293A|nr:hypothetical protein [Afifella sp. IM 167]